MPRRVRSRTDRQGGGVTLAEVERVIGSFPAQRVLVVGDLILDRFVWGRVRRISPEAPVPIVEAEGENLCLGGASNVAHNIRALGGGVEVFGVVGADAEGASLRAELRRIGAGDAGIVSVPRRVTTLKTRIIADRHHQVVRYDREDRAPIPAVVLGRISRRLQASLSRCDAVVVSDYGKGVVCRQLLAPLLTEAARVGKPVIVDPKPPGLEVYRGCSVVTPNLREAGEMAGLAIASDRDLALAGRRIQRVLDCQSVLITRGEEGMSLFRRGNGAVHIPTVAREVYDVTGAGDTVVAAIALGTACRADLVLVAHLANHAAGIVVGKVGTATVTRAELLAEIHEHPGRLGGPAATGG